MTANSGGERNPIEEAAAGQLQEIDGIVGTRAGGLSLIRRPGYDFGLHDC